MEVLLSPKPTIVPSTRIRQTKSTTIVSAPLIHRRESEKRYVGTRAVDLGVAAGAVIAAASTTAALWALAQRDGTVTEEAAPVSIMCQDFAMPPE